MSTLHEDQCIFLIISCLLLLRVRNLSDKVVEKIKTHILCSMSFFFFLKNHAVYVITWKNIVETGRQQMTTFDMYIAFWIPKITNT